MYSLEVGRQFIHRLVKRAAKSKESERRGKDIVYRAIEFVYKREMSEKGGKRGKFVCAVFEGEVGKRGEVFQLFEAAN